MVLSLNFASTKKGAKKESFKKGKKRGIIS